MQHVARLFHCIIIFFLLSSSSPLLCFASPPPSEINSRKDEAPLHLIGIIQEDELLTDLTTDPDHPKQYRTITLLVTDLLKKPNELSLQKGEAFSVNYHYIPSWSSSDYSGSNPILISPGDVVEVWLTYRNSKWEPVLSGYTVHTITSTGNYKDFVQEPFLHKLKRWERDLPLSLVLPMAVFISLAIWYFLRLWKIFKQVY